MSQRDSSASNLQSCSSNAHHLTSRSELKLEALCNEPPGFSQKKHRNCSASASLPTIPKLDLVFTGLTPSASSSDIRFTARSTLRSENFVIHDLCHNRYSQVMCLQHPEHHQAMIY